MDMLFDAFILPLLIILEIILTYFLFRDCILPYFKKRTRIVRTQSTLALRLFYHNLILQKEAFDTYKALLRTSMEEMQKPQRNKR